MVWFIVQDLVQLTHQFIDPGHELVHELHHGLRRGSGDGSVHVVLVSLKVWGMSQNWIMVEFMGLKSRTVI